MCRYTQIAMAHLIRTPVRPSPPKTRVLLLRQPIKSVRKQDEPDRTPLRLAIGLIVAVGVLAVVWLMGYLGFRLGFAPLIRVPELLGEAGGGLATGTVMLISMPRVIILAGMAEPGWLIIGFFLIAIPAAGIAAVTPRWPGGPRPSPPAAAFSYAGATAAALNAAGLIWWTASGVRMAKIAELPFGISSTLLEPLPVEAWRATLESVAGLDVLAVIAAAVWVVLVMRLVIPLWLRALAASASFFALVVVTVAMSMSNAAAAQIQAPRSVVFLDDGSLDTRLLLGFTPRHAATLRVEDQVTVIELHEPPLKMTVIGRQSIVGRLEEEGTKALRGR